MKYRRKETYTDPSVIYDNIIGKHYSLEGKFGKKPIIYADSTASGKSLAFIEDYIQNNVLPLYANTHTEASSTGLQTTRYREQARDYVRDALNAPKDEYAIIFTGAGSTGAVDKLSRVMGISPLAPPITDPSKRPVIFISPYEHHSNELPWRESQCDVVVIPEYAETGSLDYKILEEKLQAYIDRPLKIGSFSAASNVTGIKSNTQKVTEILHRYGAFAMWDFAAAGPHIGIDMKGQDLDAVFLSVHKYVGGPSTPGVLAARRSLFSNVVPSVPGGGTIKWVDIDDHKYLDDIEQREEGGTPLIVESIRAGLVLRLHKNVGPKKIEKLEQGYLQKALGKWKQNPNIIIVGNSDPQNRVSIISFLIRSPQRKNEVLHFNFIVALLNDLFGIQTRGGCSCAGPYLGRLLESVELKPILHKDYKSVDFDSSVKPGWVRVGFSYYMSQEAVDYIIAAVDLIADEGYRMLPWYKYDPESTTWSYFGESNYSDTKRSMELWDVQSAYRKLEINHHHDNLSDCYKQVSKLLLSTDPCKGPLGNTTSLPVGTGALRWFSLPEEIKLYQSPSSRKTSKNKQKQISIFRFGSFKIHSSFEKQLSQ